MTPTCPATVQDSAVITSLYRAAFTAPVENQRIFVKAHRMINGWAGPAAVFSALVPAPTA